jgi:hypothetical protein
MELLETYFKIQKEIYDYFGYIEDWVVIPLDDCTSYFWILLEETNGRGSVRFADTEKQLYGSGDYYEDEIYTQRFLPKWVYRSKDYTMVCANPNVDGNKFLRVFSNELERTS